MLTWPLSAVLIGALVACSNDPTVTPDASVNQANIQIPFPDNAALARAIDNTSLSVTVTIDDGPPQTVSPNNDNTEWVGTFSVPSDRAFPVLISWQHDGLLIARYSNSIGPLNEPTTLSLGSSDYENSGIEFDNDGDGRSNLEELIWDTDSRDLQNIDVVIPKVDLANAPGINGRYGIIWEQNPTKDWRGNDPMIDNLLIDQGADKQDGNTGYRWQALHDGVKLYIVALGEFTADETPYADSQTNVRDDTLNIYIDGDNSKGDEYDQINDFHIAIPLLKSFKPAEETPGFTIARDPDTRDMRMDDQGNLILENSALEQIIVPRGPLENNNSIDIDRNSAARGSTSLPVPPGIKYSNARGDQDQHVYEVSIILEEVGISAGAPFGLEIQIDDDIDGGARDARYAWKHPSRNPDGPDSNLSGRMPSYMGTAILGE